MPSVPTLSILIPLYNEAENLEELFDRLTQVLIRLGMTYEIICVNDGSQDATLETVLGYFAEDKHLRVIDFSRNFGKEAAMTAGLDCARGEAVILMDADLQDPPEVIPDLVAQWQQGYEVVYATRRSRQGETWFKRTTASLFYRVISYISDVPIPKNTGDFRLVDRRVVEAIKQLPERNRFMKGIFSWVGFKQISVQFDRHPRYHGMSSWSFWRLWNFALDGITSFSVIPLKFWTYFGSVFAILSLFYAAVLVLRTLIWGVDVPGYASLMVVVLFLGGINLIGLGILGEYLGRVYEEVKRRPLYVVRKIYGVDESELKG